MTTLTEQEKDIIHYSLLLRRNMIETGDPILGAADAERQNLPIRALSVEQMQLIILITDLIKKVREWKQ